MKVKKNDTVLVMTGKDAGKTGKVLSAFPTENRIKVDGINVQKRHKKARSAQDAGGIVEQVGAIDASNVYVVCPNCGKPTRVGYAVIDGKKVRVCKQEGCGKVLDAKKEVKAAVAKAKKTTKAKAAEEKPAKETKAKATEEKPDKETKAKRTSKKKEATDAE